MTQHYDGFSSQDSSAYDSSAYDNSAHDSSAHDSSAYNGSHGFGHHDAIHGSQHDPSHYDPSHPGHYDQSQHWGGFDAHDISAFDGAHSFHSEALHSGFSQTHSHIASEYSSSNANDFNTGATDFNSSFSSAGHGTSFMAASRDDNCPYTTIDSSGHVYLHPHGKSYEHEYVGYIRDRNFYNKGCHYIGHVERDGCVYDDHNHLLGWQRCGTIYDKDGHEIPGAPHTSRGAIGAGAYILFVQFGGV